MAAFDPDAYLAQKPAAAPAGPAAFDPDAYLRSREVPQVDAMGRVVQDAIPAPRKRGFVEQYVAPIVEVPTAIATAIPAQLIGQVVGVAEGIAGGDYSPAATQKAQRRAEEVAGRLTYKPASETSQEILRGIGKVVEESKIAPVMPGTTGAQGAVRAGLKAAAAPVAAEVDLVKNALKIASDSRAAAKAERLMMQSYARGPQIDAAKDANRLGIALDPVISNPTKANRLRSLMTDPTEMHNILSDVNKPKYTNIAKREMGIPEREALTSSKPFDAARARVSKPYQQIETMESLAPSEEIVSKVRNILEEGLIGSTTAESQVAGMVDDAIAKIQKGMTGKQVIDNISNLRRKAQRVYNSPAAMPDQIDVADARMAIANALEDLIEKNITDAKLIKDFRNARVEMAKIYGYERATDMRTGQVDIQKIAKQVEKNPTMTGDIAALGRIAANFPEVTRMTPSEIQLLQRLTRAGGAATAGAALGSTLGVGGTIAGGLTGAIAGRVGSKVLSRRMTSPEFQAKRAVPQDFRQQNMLANPSENQNALRR